MFDMKFNDAPSERNWSLTGPLHPLSSVKGATITAERSNYITLRNTEEAIEKMPALKFVRSVSLITIVKVSITQA
jgi:hypothetical protein